MKNNIDFGKNISVCLLTYNHVHLIKETLVSILNQTISSFELIISDDCSTDGTWEFLQSYALSNESIKLIRTPRNLGMAENANFAVSFSSRKYIALLHHDDICSNILLEKWYNALEDNPTSTFVFNPYALANSNIIWQEKRMKSLFKGDYFLKKFLFPRWGCIVRGTAMIRRTAWVLVGGMDKRFSLLADIDLWMKLSLIGTVSYVDEILIYIRHDRPKDYPEEYLYSNFSWKRMVILYEIHAYNRNKYYKQKPYSAFIKWQMFRFRLNLNTFFWLLYAIIKKNKKMLIESIYSKTKYDYCFLNFFRSFSIKYFK